jgi:hypothetical protein
MVDAEKLPRYQSLFANPFCSVVAPSGSLPFLKRTDVRIGTLLSVLCDSSLQSPPCAAPNRGRVEETSPEKSGS